MFFHVDPFTCPYPGDAPTPAPPAIVRGRHGRITTVCVLALTLSGCYAWVPREYLGSVGTPSHGALYGGVALPVRGEGYALHRPWDSTHWGTPELVASLQRLGRRLVRAHPTSRPLQIGDLSRRFGGAHPRHRSHRSGRDVDLLYFMTDVDGRPVDNRTWPRFDRFGVALQMAPIRPGGFNAGGLKRHPVALGFDVRRNWAVVKGLLSDPEITIEWMFASLGVKRILLNFAKHHERDRTLLAQAAETLHRPGDSLAHDDHFHVRIKCSPRERLSGCRSYGPERPWDETITSYLPPQRRLTPSEATLIEFLMRDLEPLPEQSPKSAISSARSALKPKR